MRCSGASRINVLRRNYLLCRKSLSRLFLFPIPENAICMTGLVCLVSVAFLSILVTCITFVLSNFVLNIYLPSVNFRGFSIEVLIVSIFFHIFVKLLPVLIVRCIFDFLFGGCTLTLKFDFFVAIFSVVTDG